MSVYCEFTYYGCIKDHNLLVKFGFKPALMFCFKVLCTPVAIMARKRVHGMDYQL